MTILLSEISIIGFVHTPIHYYTIYMHYYGLGVCGFFVNSSIADEGARMKTSLLHVDSQFSWIQID